MAETFYAFIKNNIVENICVFDKEDEDLADRVAHEQGFDDAVWTGQTKPKMYSTYNGKKFVDPTLDYLFERGVSMENEAMKAERLAKEALE